MIAIWWGGIIHILGARLELGIPAWVSYCLYVLFTRKVSRFIQFRFQVVRSHMYALIYEELTMPYAS